MEQITEKMRVQRALKYSTMIASDRAFEIGNEVLVWRENAADNRIGGFSGHFKVLGKVHERRMVYIHDCKVDSARPFNIAQVKPYRSPDNFRYSFVSSIFEGLHDYRSCTEF